MTTQAPRGAGRVEGGHVRWRRAVGWWVSRPALAAAVIYAALSLLMVGQGLLPGRTLSGSDLLWGATPWSGSTPSGVRTSGGHAALTGSNPLLSDAATQFQPFLQYSRSVFPRVALWNPYVGSGRPFLANVQSAVFSPFSLPAYVLPFWHSLAVIAALKLFVAALGTYFLARALGMRFGGALLAGVVFAFGLFIVLWLSWPQSSVWVLIPWCLLLTEHVVRRAGPLSFAGLAAVVALQYLAGHPESSVHALLATVAFFVLRVSQARLAGRRVAVPIAVFGLALIAGTALAAITLLPFLQLLSHSDLAARRNYFESLSGVPHQPPRYLLSIFLPDYWGRATQTPLYEAVFAPEIAYYAGALTLMLALAALVLRRSWERIAVAGFGVFSLAIAVGLQPVLAIFAGLPVFHTLKNYRMAVLFLLCVALLAGWGLDELSGRVPTPRGRRALLGMCGALLCLPVVWVALRGELSLRHLGRALDVAWGFVKPGGVAFASHSSTAQIIRLAGLLGWVVLAGAGLALIALRLHRRLPSPGFIGLAVVLIGVDLFRAGMGFNPAIPIAHAVQPATAAIRYLQSRRPNRFVGVAYGPFDSDPLPANVAMRYGLYDARAYDYPVDQRYAALWATAFPVTFDGAPQSAAVTPTTSSKAALANARKLGIPLTARTHTKVLGVLRLLSVTDILEDPNAPPPDLPGVRLGEAGVDARVYTYDGALPRVSVVAHQQVVSGAGRALAAVTAPRFDGRRLAVTERRIPSIPAEGADLAAPGSARLLSYGAERVVATATSSRPGLLVLTDNYSPGWKATVDGRPTPIYRVDYLLRGVPLPAGSHRVVFSYQPASWRWGWIISALTLLALLATVLIGWRRRRPPDPGQPDGHTDRRVRSSPQAKAPESFTVCAGWRTSEPG